MTFLEEYHSVEKGLGLICLEDSVLRFQGKDIRSFLQGILSNDTRQIKANLGLPAFFLNAKGKWIAELKLFQKDDSIFAKTSAAESQSLQEAIRPLILFSESQISDMSPDYQWILALGGQTHSFLQDILGISLGEQNFSQQACEWEGFSFDVIRQGDFRLETCLLLCERKQTAALIQKLLSTQASYPIEALHHSTLEAFRIESKIPLFGQDVDDKTIPLEAGQEDHISYTKGCYVGQETISRIKHYGRVNKRLVRVKISSGKGIEVGDEISFQDKIVGKITSLCQSPHYQADIALAILPQDVCKEAKVQIPLRQSEGEILE